MVEKKGEGGPLRAVNVVVGVNSGVGARHRAVRGTGSAERCFSKLHLDHHLILRLELSSSCKLMSSIDGSV